MTIPQNRRDEHLACLLALTSVPTGAGHESRVIRWIEDWLARRPALRLSRDRVGNLVVSIAGADASDAPLFITAHLDHPAFHVESADGRDLILSFRGGVMDDYFPASRIVVHAQDGSCARAGIDRQIEKGEVFKRFSARLDSNAPVQAGDLATWDLEASEIGDDGIVRAPACDDLAAVAAALCTMDEVLTLRDEGRPIGDVRLLFTLGEEVGFLGAIGACRFRTMPERSRVIALENSRALPEAPIGGGPIVRVGDRLSVFSPRLLRSIDLVCERIAGGPQPTASQKLSEAPAWKWQRRLMSGGACEATAYCAFGYESACICLPLGNYHNMGNLDEVQAGSGTARIEREFIARSDFDGLIDLLVACCEDLPEDPGMLDRLDRLWQERRFVLGL